MISSNAASTLGDCPYDRRRPKGPEATSRADLRCLSSRHCRWSPSSRTTDSVYASACLGNQGFAIPCSECLRSASGRGLHSEPSGRRNCCIWFHSGSPDSEPHRGNPCCNPLGSPSGGAPRLDPSTDRSSAMDALLGGVPRGPGRGGSIPPASL